MFQPSNQSHSRAQADQDKQQKPLLSSGRQGNLDVLARLREQSAATSPVRPEQKIQPMPPAPNLNRRLTETKFIILDTETTSADPENTHVIEVAAQGWSLNKKIKFPRIFETKINPGPDVKIPPSSSAVHHITDEDVVGSPLLSDVLPSLVDMSSDHPMVAYNAEFDRCVLHSCPELHSRYWLDVYRLAMRTWHIGEENENGFALTSFKQQELRYWLGLRPTAGDAHRAAADIMVTGLVLQAAADRYLEAGRPDDFNEFSNWVASPILHKTFPIGFFGMTGKTPEDVEDWQLRKLFDPTNHLYDALCRFNVLDYARPEYMRRGLDSPPARRGYSK